MNNKKSSFTYQDLLECAEGKLFGQGNPQLPRPNMLMIDRINSIQENGGMFNRGELKAELDIKPELWFFECHFPGDPVMPGCLGLDAMWQLLGFFMGWNGCQGQARASGCGNIKFRGEILPDCKMVRYHIHIQKITHVRNVAVGLALGEVFADERKVYVAQDLKVAVYK